MADQRFYSEDEAQQILSLAARDVANTAMSREELIKAAGEMGITADAIERAEDQLREQQFKVHAEEDERRLRKEFRRVSLRKLYASIWTFAWLNLFFGGIWLVAGRGYFWPIWITIWILFEVASNFSAVFLSGTQREHRYRKWRRRQLGGEDSKEEDHVIIGAAAKL